MKCDYTHSNHKFVNVPKKTSGSVHKSLVGLLDVI
jgi:hypothetical protein